MRALFHLLVVTCLVWCALGIAEPAQARVDAGERHAVTGIGHVDQSDDQDATGEDRGDHHHCPVAPDTVAASAVSPTLAPRPPLFALRRPALASLTRAPPLEPPAAA